MPNVHRKFLCLEPILERCPQTKLVHANHLMEDLFEAIKDLLQHIVTMLKKDFLLNLQIEELRLVWSSWAQVELEGSVESILQNYFWDPDGKQQARCSWAQGRKGAVTRASWFNFLVSSLKFKVWFVTSGHVLLLAEVIHSVADIANQALLAYRSNSSKRVPDALYPYGYFKKRFLWSLIYDGIFMSWF